MRSTDISQTLRVCSIVINKAIDQIHARTELTRSLSQTHNSYLCINGFFEAGEISIEIKKI